jgi:hypothetical protein
MGFYDRLASRSVSGQEGGVSSHAVNLEQCVYVRVASGGLRAPWDPTCDNSNVP